MSYWDMGYAMLTHNVNTICPKSEWCTKNKINKCLFYLLFLWGAMFLEFSQHQTNRQHTAKTLSVWMMDLWNSRQCEWKQNHFRHIKVRNEQRIGTVAMNEKYTERFNNLLGYISTTYRFSDVEGFRIDQTYFQNNINARTNAHCSHLQWIN